MLALDQHLLVVHLFCALQLHHHHAFIPVSPFYCGNSRWMHGGICSQLQEDPTIVQNSSYPCEWPIVRMAFTVLTDCSGKLVSLDIAVVWISKINHSTTEKAIRLAVESSTWHAGTLLQLEICENTFFCWFAMSCWLMCRFRQSACTLHPSATTISSPLWMLAALMPWAPFWRTSITSDSKRLMQSG